MIFYRIHDYRHKGITKAGTKVKKGGMTKGLVKKYGGGGGEFGNVVDKFIKNLWPSLSLRA